MADSFSDSRYPPLTHTRDNSSFSQSVSLNSLSSQSSLRQQFPPRTSSQLPSQLSHSHLQQQQQLPDPSQMSVIHGRKPSIAAVAVDSQRSRSRAYSTKSSTSTKSLKRKPLPPNAAVISPHQSPSSPPITIDTSTEIPARRSFSEDSPLLHVNPSRLHDTTSWNPQPCIANGELNERQQANDDDRLVHRAVNYREPQFDQLDLPNDDNRDYNLTRNQTPLSAGFAHHERLFSESGLSASSRSTAASFHDIESSNSRPTTMSVLASKPLPLTLDLPGRLDHETTGDLNKALPKSPSPTLLRGSKLGSFFTWRSDRSSLSPSSSNLETTNDKGHLSVSSIPSVRDSQPLSTQDHSSSSRGNSNVPTTAHSSYFTGVDVPTHDNTTILEEMEDELKAISSELAISIRREMELEDLVERMQSETVQSERRNSDYFSDSGASSIKYGNISDARTDEQERLHRRAEREKAQLRLDLTDRVNEERSRRKVLEEQIQQLEDRAIRAEQRSSNTEESYTRLRDLEITCEDLRRRLNEERQIKENFEDLLTALKGDLHNSHNERDNLREEIVPQLRAQIEGLEAQASIREQQAYENAKLQQEVQSLRDENSTLVNARNVQADMQQQMNRYNTILESETTRAVSPLTKMSRSATVSGRGRDRSVGSSLNRSTSVKGNVESRDELAERVKDIEAQRDALHKALKSVLERQEHQNRIHQAKVKQLQMERDRFASSTPRRYDREVKILKDEILSLRRRAEEAMEQKWQCEKGLGGLKMDLERAEQEIASLKKLLAESSPKAGGTISRSNSVLSQTLERAYEDLRQAHSQAKVDVDAMSAVNIESPEKVDSSRELLEERNALQVEAESLRATNASLHASERDHSIAELSLADELKGSADRVEQLAAQVQGQLATNASLRQRLVDTIDRGEQEQKSNTARVVFMQERLQKLEKELVIAQQGSERILVKHEEEVKSIKNAHSSQLVRLKASMGSPKTFSPKSPLSPLFLNKKIPRLDRTTSGPGLSMTEHSEVADLKVKVEALEQALEDADEEMEDVMKRMNHAQIEVMELWNEREEAVRTTRKLELEVAAERKKGFLSRIRTLQG